MVEETNLAGRYRLHERLATGGMGAVYAGTDERLGRRVAVKMLKTELAEDPRFIERFRREARSVAALSHPNIATVFDYGETDDGHFIVMELAEGRDLARLLREEGPLEPAEAVAIARQTCEALDHAHAAGVVHRDIKPANIIVSDTGRVKVTDFGIARATGDSTLTATGSVLGTVQYISPEQASGEGAGAASDLYSLGIVLYEMLTGSVPFTAESPVAVAMRHVSDPVPSVRELSPEVPPALDAVVATATAKEPEQRFAGAEDMAAALATSLDDDGTTAVLPAGGEAPTQELTRGVWPIPDARYDPSKLGRRVLIGLALLALLAAGLLMFRLASTDEQPAARRTGRGTAGGAQDPEPDGTSPGTGFILPPLVGQDAAEVRAQLLNRGIDVVVEPKDSVEPEGTIVGHTPEAGATVLPGDRVTLVVSTGRAPEDAEPEDAEDEGEEDEEEESKESEEDSDTSGGPGKSKGKGNGKAKGKDKD